MVINVYYMIYKWKKKMYKFVQQFVHNLHLALYVPVHTNTKQFEHIQKGFNKSKNHSLNTYYFTY